MNRHMIPLVVFALLLVLLWVGLSLNPRELPSPLIGRAVPTFAVPELLDESRTLSSEQLKGQVTVFNVFASWCVSCRAEHHLLLEMRQRGVHLVGLNYKDQRNDALAYLRAGGGNPYAAIGHDLDGRAAIEWGVYATPETFIIDRHGVIRYKHIGPLHRQLIEGEIMPLIRQLEQEV